MKYFPKLFAIGGCALVFFTAYYSQLVWAKTSSSTTTTYQPSNEDFPNPERGFAEPNEAWPPGLKINWNICDPTPANMKKYTFTEWNKPLDLEFLKAQRAKGISLSTIRYHLADFRNRPLSPKYLKHLDNDFATARKAGTKSILHFAYNWPMGGPDTSVDRVLSHLDQLKPILKKNADVIAFMDAGFVGCWGEWHTSVNNLIGYDKDGEALMNNNTKLILDKIFEALPKERMVTVRYPRFKFNYFGSKNSKPIAPLKPSEAFNGSKKARWGQEDDCPVCGEWNASTYWSERKNAAEMKKFLSEDNRYVVQSGEPGGIIPGRRPATVDEDGDGYINNYDACPRMLGLLSQMRWSSINVGFDPGSPISVYKRWKKDGCYDTISKSLGYRFRLVDSSIPSNIRSGGNLAMNFKLVNEGWASPYNPRNLEIILRNRKNASVFRLGLRDDPRFWQAGKTHVVNVKKSLPRNMPAGEYDVLLNLPDPTPTLKNRPEYSIRLANQNVWEANSGYNSLLRKIVVTPAK
jgi:Domain of unknown function (DUF4832)/Domain of unknown function (DUF4874)